jgi:hypothetical protein
MPFEAFMARREDFLKILAGYLEIDYEICLELVSGGSYNTKVRSGSGYRLTANEYVLDLVNGYWPERTELPKLLRRLLKRIPMKNYVFALSPTDRDRVQTLLPEPTSGSRKNSTCSWSSMGIA